MVFGRFLGGFWWVWVVFRWYLVGFWLGGFRWFLVSLGGFW